MRKRLAARGGKIALNDLFEDRTGSACEWLRAQGIAAKPFAADVRDRGAVERMVEAVEDRLGPPTVVVTAAGVYPNTRFLDLDDEEWHRVLDTNLTGTFLTCQVAARLLVRTERSGSFVTISSGAATSALYGWAHYSKAGVCMLTKSMAMELAPYGIRVNAILPGYVDVEEGGRHLSESYKQAARAVIPLRPGNPSDIANAALLLASPLAGWITGVTLPVDGGSSAGRASLRPTGT